MFFSQIVKKNQTARHNNQVRESMRHIYNTATPDCN